MDSNGNKRLTGNTQYDSKDLIEYNLKNYCPLNLSCRTCIFSIICLNVGLLEP